MWNEYLVDKLDSIGFKPSLIDSSVFYRDDVIFMVYVDDGIFPGNNDTQLQYAIKELQGLGLNIEDQGHPADYVGVNISKLQDGSYEFTQRALLTPSSMTSGSTTPSPSLFQPRYCSNCMLSRMTLHSTWISTTDLLLASLTT